MQKKRIFALTKKETGRNQSDLYNPKKPPGTENQHLEVNVFKNVR